jgi:spore maturation protein CgeB
VAARMKILLVGANYLDTPVYSLQVLLQEQHQVRVFDPHQHLGLPKAFGGQLSLLTDAWTYFLRAAIREPFKIANRHLVSAVQQFQPDLVFIFSIQLISPETIERIKAESDAVVIGWFMDAVSNFERGYFMLADYDALFFVDPYIVRTLRSKLGNERVHLLPICCDPLLHRTVSLTPQEQREYGCDLTIAGNLYAYRICLLDQFQDYDLKIWGRQHRWLRHPLCAKQTGRVVLGLEKSKAMRAAKIVLNNNHYANIEGINKRTFEMAGCGAFQLTDAPGIAAAFVPGREIITFDSKQDLKDKVDYYLAHPEERAEIAERAQRRAHAEHTFADRWQKLLEILADRGFRLPGAERQIPKLRSACTVS